MKIRPVSIIRSLVLFAVFVLLDSCHDDIRPSPTIVSVSPDKGRVGTTVTITGTNFSLTSSDNRVEFNGLYAVISSCTTTTIQVNVPAGVTTGKVTVSVNGKGKAESPADFIVDDCSACGVVEKFLASHDDYIVEPINKWNSGYEDSGTRRGFYFIVDKKIRIKAVGGLFRKKGTYPIEIRSGITTLYATTVTANDTATFAFENVTADFQLTPGVPYILLYCGENHDSVYDLSLVRDKWTDKMLQPFDFGDVNFITMFYNYTNDCSYVGPQGYGSWDTNGIFMRGIVDFKYEVVE